ncbi:hypothetical protein V3C99_009754 [Haemonchus contortus]
MIPSHQEVGIVLVLLLFGIGLCLTEERGPALEKETSGADGAIPEDIVSIIKVNEKAGIDRHLFDGDILLADTDLRTLTNTSKGGARQKRQVVYDANKWPNNKVFYYFDSTIPPANQAYIKAVLNYLSARICIDFVVDATAPNRIKVLDGAGCYSSDGMQGGEQIISLSSDCIIIGTIARQFMQALGAAPTHVRFDRNDSIIVDLTNVPPDKHQYFDDTFTLYYTPYEYGSVMHYPSNFLATSGNSLIPRYSNRYLRTMGGRAISFYDILFINVHYQCYAPCSGIAAKCVNGGVANPRHCSTNCICPAGYAGALCNQRPPACGATLTATTTWVTRKVTVGDSTIANTSSTYKMCTDWVKAPAGKKIQIRVTALQGVSCTNGCWVHAIEPKIDTDKRLTNARICCPEQLNNILPSRINPTPIVFYSIRRAATFTYQYRYVTQ